MNRIPKKLHMYWDRSPMSRLQVFTMETFHKLNPDWKIYVYIPIQDYTRNASYIPNYYGKDFFYLIEGMDCVDIVETDIYKYGIDKDLHNILRSDIFRYHILYNEGGLWSDFDVVWLKPISHMNSIDYIGNVSMQAMGAIACLYNMTTGHHNIGILFGAVHNSLYKTLIDKSVEIQNKKIDRDTFGHQAFGSAMWGELYVTLQDVLNAHFDVVGIPYETFAPYSIFNMDQLFIKDDLSPLNNNNVIGLHWFNGHTHAKRYVNEDLFSKDYRCSLTSVLRSLEYTNV